MRKKQPKSRKRQIINCLSKQLRLNGSLTMFTQTFYEAIKRFQSHFPREVVYVEKAVTVDLDSFSCKISDKFGKNPKLLIWLYYKSLSYDRSYTSIPLV